MQENFVLGGGMKLCFVENCALGVLQHTCCVIELFFLLLPFRESKLLITNIIRLLWVRTEGCGFSHLVI